MRVLVGLDVRLGAYIAADRLGNASLERLATRMRCFVVGFVAAEWEIYDWGFVGEANLVGYWLRGLLESVPVVGWCGEGGRAASQVLEEAFSLSRSEFERRLAALGGPGAVATGKATPFFGAWGHRVLRIAAVVYRGGGVFLG